MPLLLDLPNELLEEISKGVGPTDLVNFILSCKALNGVVSDKRLLQRMVLKRQLGKIPSDWRGLKPHGFHGLLDWFLRVPRMADYVEEMVFRDWIWPYDPEEDDPYPAIEKAVEDNKSIPSEEKESWLSKLRAHDEDPVIALLLPRLHYLTFLAIVLLGREDFFILKALQSIARDPNSLSLSRLREVKIFGTTAPSHRLDLAIACAALPSLITLKAHRLVEGPLDSAEHAFELTPRSSTVQDLTIYDCRYSADMLFKLIRSAKSLRSLTHTYIGEATRLPFVWTHAALLQFASTSLEELTLRQPLLRPDLDRPECSFKSCQKLLILTIDYALLMGHKMRATNQIVAVLPASLQILNLFGCQIYSPAWFKKLIKWVVRVKKRKLPCLKQLNFEETLHVDQCSKEGIRGLCAAAMKAGFELHVTPEPE